MFVCDGLAVPVVDLLDVAEDDLVFSSHVLWNPSDLQPGHEALRHTRFIFNLNVQADKTLFDLSSFCRQLKLINCQNNL